VILGIISSDLGVGRWAREKKVNHLKPIGDLETLFKNQPFDYLFSIVNEHILREDVLRLPRKLAINYHDALLPRYAGTHATSWALMNGETAHGVTWHIISDLVDGGDTLKQQEVEVTANDTALTLNTKCFEAAIKSFALLVDDLSGGTEDPKKQDLTNRSFYPRFKRPAGGCVISWDRPASEISSLIRALDFGPHPNPLGSPKLALRGDFVIVQEIEVLASMSLTPSGTITKIGSEFLRVSTRDREVVLRTMLTPEGRAISIPDLVARFGLHEGYRFEGLDLETTKRLESLYAMTSKREAFWVNRLSGLEPAVCPYSSGRALPGDTLKYAEAMVSIPTEALTLVGQYGKRGRGSYVILASFAALIARLAATDSFDLGFRNNRLRTEVSGLEGFFTTHLPMRLQIDCSQSISETLSAVEMEIESLKEHHAYPRDLTARYPELSSKIKLGSDFTLPIVVEIVEQLGEHKPMTGNEMTLVISEDGSQACWVYDSAQLSAESVGRLNIYFANFLREIAVNSDKPVAHITLLPEHELRTLLIDWNDTSSDYAKDKCIHQLFEDQVSRTPDAVALVCENSRLTYKELNSRANQLGHYLRKMGVGPEVLVGVCVERSMNMLVGVLGILKAGGAYVPLDPAYPKERLAFMLEDSQAPIVLTQQKLIGELSESPSQLVCLDSDWESIAQEPEVNLVSKITPKNLAYVIYTSGSTGKPKGVAIEHRSTIALLHWAMLVFTSEHLKGVLASTSICFDLSVYEMFAPLSCGGTIILVENVLHLPTAPSAREVTLINTVPSAITELLRLKGLPPSVRTVNLAGEPLKTELVRKIYENSSVKEVFDLYGPTEDTTYSTFTLRHGNRMATIGRPISNTQVYILDRYLQPLPVGIPGELYLGGDGLARGYLNRPELTGERFLDNPFSQMPGSRVYRTGDLARFLPSGEIEYLGRIDKQVKIRGFRIELGEVEAAICSHPLVTESVVIASSDLLGEKRLVGYIVTKPDQQVESNDLRAFLRQGLPDYMVPSTFIELDEIPLTPNGKIDRKALPVPDSTISRTEAAFVAHRDDLELRLTKIWEEILGLHPIGIKDNFFDLGGHSLQAVRMFADVEVTFGKSIPLATILQSPTIEALAQILRQDNWSAPESSLVPIQPNGSNPNFFCVHAKGGNVLFYKDLARYLGSDQPFYGLQARRLAGRQIGHSTVEEMAEYYIKEIQTLQPEGPYFLGGSSFGGLAAYEMAQQLLAQGHEVALLALLDTGTPDYPKLLPGTTVLRSKVYDFVRRIQHQRDSLKLLNSRERLEYVMKKAEKVRQRYRRKLNNKYKKAGRMFYSMLNRSLPKSFIQVEDKLWKAGQKYEPKAYSGKVTLFRASVQPLGIYPDPTLGWGPLAPGGLEIHEVPGHHGSIVAEPYVRALAQELTHSIEKALESIRAHTTFPPPNYSEILVDSNPNPDGNGAGQVFGIAASWPSVSQQ